MTRFTDDEAAGFLRSWGPARPTLLGEGMEGTVYALDASLVAKVWFAKPAPAVALDTEMAMYDLISDALGYSRTDLLVYRAAYSLITANAFDPDGNDGHFAWCVAP